MTERPLHVVFLARWYPNRYDPMFGLFVQRHAEAVARYDKVSVVYVHADENAKCNYEIEQDTENGVNAIRVYFKKSNRLVSAFRFFVSCKKGLRLAGRHDLIHVHVLTRMGVVAWLEKVFHKTPYLITEHWSRYLPGNGYKGLVRKALTKIVVRHASMVTTVTSNLADAMKSHGLNNSRYVILPNVVDTEMFKPHPHDNPIPKIIHISCFEDKSKNISGLLEAFCMMKSENVGFEAVLIGEGVDYEMMKQRKDALGLQDCVRFTGLLQGQHLADELASGDFLVLSSNYENMPVVILEALSCGLPIVSTRVGGIDEIVSDSNGILVAPKDASSLASAMTTMCSKHSSYDAETLRQGIVQKYGTEQVGKLLCNWYDQIIGSGRSNS